MRHTYTISAGPSNALAFALGTPPQLTEAGIVQVLAGTLVRDLVAGPQGAFEVQLELYRQTHQDALSEIAAALAQRGFDVTEAVVVEWATSVLEGLVLGGLGGGAIASSTRNAESAAFGAFAGGIFGMILGSFVPKATAAYQAQRADPVTGSWQLVQVQMPATRGLAWGLGPQSA